MNLDKIKDFIYKNYKINIIDIKIFYFYIYKHKYKINIKEIK